MTRDQVVSLAQFRDSDQAGAFVDALLELVREEREAVFRISGGPSYTTSSPSLPGGPEDYAECADCAAKPGAIVPCPACLHNRGTIGALRQRLMAGAAETELSRFRARVAELETELTAERDGAAKNLQGRMVEQEFARAIRDRLTAAEERIAELTRGRDGAVRVAELERERDEVRRVLGFARDNIAGLTKLARDAEDDRRRLAARIVELEALATVAPTRPVWVLRERTIGEQFPPYVTEVESVVDDHLCGSSPNRWYMPARLYSLLPGSPSALRNAVAAAIERAKGAKS